MTEKKSIDVLEKRKASEEELFQEIKKACIKFLKKEGIYQSTISKILFVFHALSCEMFEEILKFKKEKEQNLK